MATPVTNAQFLAFVQANPQWRRGNAPKGVPPRRATCSTGRPVWRWARTQPQQPVVNELVRRRRLLQGAGRAPAGLERVEYAAAADELRKDARRDPVWRNASRAWYARPSNAALPRGLQAANAFGLRDIHGLGGNGPAIIRRCWSTPTTATRATRTALKVLRRRRAVDGRPRELRGADAGGDAVPLDGADVTRNPIPLREERSMKTPLIVLALLLPCISTAVARDAPLPPDSVYQLRRRWSTRRDMRRHGAQRGKPRVVSMFYTSCPYMPADRGQRQGGRAPAHAGRTRSDRDHPLVSLDPARDTPKALQALAGKRQLDARRWSLLAPRADDVRAIAGVLGVRYRQLANGEFNHSSELILLDADGRILARSDKVGSSVPDPAFVAQVRRALAPAAKGR